MTLRSEINFINDKNYVPVLDHGFVGLVDHMGNDELISRAARNSYGKGTKQVNDDRNLIRYLMRHEHTTPFEMGELVFHIKLPIFVMRQLVRHRTASINEYSARYSVVTDEFYLPNPEDIKPQSVTNKQGRAGELDSISVNHTIDDMNSVWDYCFTVYERFINDFGVARETARTVLPVGSYTEIYWKANLKNFLHMARLRMDSHAQWEIQEFARAMYDLARPLFPLSCEAFEDYIINSTKFSSPEVCLLMSMIDKSQWQTLIEKYQSEESLARDFNLSMRELSEFKEKIKLP